MRISLIFFAVVIIGLTPLILCAKDRLPTSKPLNSLITFDAFKKLFLESASKVEGTKEFWEINGDQKDRAYLGGGAARMLLHWLNQQLQTHSVAEVKNLKVPSLQELADDSNFEGEFDVFLAAAEFSKAQKRPYSGTDIISLDSYHQMTETSGPTLQWILVNPHQVKDPFQALESYWAGKLDFRLHSNLQKNEENLRGLGLSHWSSSLRTLRYLRTLPELQLSEPSVAKLTEYRVQIPKKRETPAQRESLSKEFLKLTQAHNNDFVETFKAAQNAISLKQLSSSGVELIVPRSVTPEQFCRALARVGFTGDEILSASQTIDYGPVAQKKIKMLIDALPGSGCNLRAFSDRGLEASKFAK